MTEEEILQHIAQIPTAATRKKLSWSLPSRTATCSTPQEVLETADQQGFDATFELVNHLHGEIEGSLRAGRGHPTLRLYVVELTGTSTRKGRDVPNLLLSKFEYADIVKKCMTRHQQLLVPMLARPSLDFSLVLGMLGAYLAVNSYLDAHRIPYAVIVQYFGPRTDSCTPEWGSDENALEEGRLAMVTIAQWHGGTFGLETPIFNTAFGTGLSAEEIVQSTRVGETRPVGGQYAFMGDYLLEAARTYGDASRAFLDAIKAVDVEATRRVGTPQYVDLHHVSIPVPTTFLERVEREWAECLPALDMNDRVERLSQKFVELTQYLNATGPDAARRSGMQIEDLIEAALAAQCLSAFGFPIQSTVRIDEEAVSTFEGQVARLIDRLTVLGNMRPNVNPNKDLN